MLCCSRCYTRVKILVKGRRCALQRVGKRTAEIDQTTGSVMMLAVSGCLSWPAKKGFALKALCAYALGGHNRTIVVFYQLIAHLRRSIQVPGEVIRLIRPTLTHHKVNNIHQLFVTNTPSRYETSQSTALLVTWSDGLPA